MLLVFASILRPFERPGQRVDQSLPTHRQQNLAALRESDGLTLRIMPELFLPQFLSGVVALLVAYALVDGFVAATYGLKHSFSAVEHCVELTFPPVLEKLPRLSPQLPGRLRRNPRFEVEGRMRVYVDELGPRQGWLGSG